MINDNVFNWGNLLIGIQFLLGVQLVVLAALHFAIKSKNTRIPLAFLCLILGLWFFKHVFYNFWNDNLFLFIVIGPGKPVFAGALLLFYYKSFTVKLEKFYAIKHLIAPSIYYILLIIFRFFLINNNPQFDQLLSIFFTSGIFIIFWYYFFITQKELQRNVRNQIIPKAYKKIMFLFYSLYIFLLQIPIWDLFKNIIDSMILPDNIQKTAVYLYTNIFQYLREDVAFVYIHILGFFLFLYGLTEVGFFKKFFLPKLTSFNENSINNKNKIDDIIQHHFYVNKLFKDPDLTLESCVKTINIPKRELVDYLLITNQGSFKNFVILMRIEEFKMLLKKKKYQHFDLVGLANECGFKSRTTFFRVFKEIEGVTPNEYKKSLNKN